ncbi:hypothetical protein PVAND_002859 [Polypedilum vanderplanki]|uniref:Uncharacterized protein n=1 Tax=Polypedilum vanderplanki TaxID=319348 RepID=A0A9J6BSP5_POLVA|nr:hypothetical protein PVAND_002859 [Polypedilum vanderplanki]
MRLINKVLIVLFICARNSIHALPVQSKALENVDDQLFWQAAWFSEDSNDRAASPFTSDSKRISPKSIFIIPEKSASYCSPGYRIDENGKCIKIVSIQQTSEESKLASLITTDDTANFDYDYWNEEDEYTQTTDNNESLKLPLVPILNESHENENDDNDNNNNNNNSNENAKKIIIKENDEIHSTSVTESSTNVISTSHMPPMTTTTTQQTFQNFHQDNKTDSVQVIIATLSSDNYGWESISDKNESNIMMTYDHASTETTSVNEFKNDEEEEKENFKSQTTTIAPTIEISTKNNVMQDRNDADSQNIEPTSSSSISNSTDEDDLLDYSIFNETTFQTEDTIIEKINFDDVSLMQNESLLISYENVNSTNIDYEDSTTTIEPLVVDLTSSTVEYEGSTDDSDDSSSSMPTTIDLDEQSYNGDQESKNKFIYQHLTSITEKTIPTTTTERNKIKFPNDEQPSNRIKFPDDEIAPQTQSTSIFSWPRENHKITTNIFQFWNQQPLIADSLQRIRSNSKSFSDNFFPYTRNQKLQIVTPQQHY